MRKLRTSFEELLRDMQIPEFILNLFLAMMATETFLMLIVDLISSKNREREIFLVIALVCGITLLSLNFRFRKCTLFTILTIAVFDGLLIPAMLLRGCFGYSVAMLWLAVSMTIIYALLERVYFLTVLVCFIFEYSYLYSNYFFHSIQMNITHSNDLNFPKMAASFIGVAVFMLIPVYAQEAFYYYQKKKIVKSSSKIERAGNAKSQFLANMSYEIRTPMNSIINLSEIMMKDQLDGETKTQVGTIREASYDLLSIIDDVLTYAKIDAGEMHLIKEAYSFEKLQKMIVRSVSEELQKKNLLLDIRIDHDIPKTLIGDSVAIRQIFLYLLFIAIDSTTTGRIVLEIRCERDEAAQTAKFFCRIADTGRGLSEIDIQSLFGMYSTYDSRQSSDLKGIALKYSICKELLGMMGGEIEVKSIEDVGLCTSFTFCNEVVDATPMLSLEDEIPPRVLIYTGEEKISKWQNFMEGFGIRPVFGRNYYGFDRLVRDQRFDFIFITDDVYESVENIIRLYQCEEYTYVSAQNNAIYGDFGKCRILRRPFSAIEITEVLNHRWKLEDYKKSATAETFEAKNARVLVVDDNVVNLKVAAAIFAKYGINIAVATSGQEGLKKIENEKYDLILLDMAMPDYRGDEILSLIREKKDQYFQEVPIIALTAQNGASVREEMIALGFQEYLAKPIKRRYLEKCLLSFLPEEMIERVVTEKETKKPDAPETKIEGGLNTDKGLLNIGFNQDAYAAILNTYYSEGMKYLEQLPALLEAGNIQLFTTNVHGIKSSSASIGAMEVSTLFKELEFAGKDNRIDEINQKFEGYLAKFREILELVKDYLIHNGKFAGKVETEDNLEEQEAQELTGEQLLVLKTELDKMNLKVTDTLMAELATKNFGAEWNRQVKAMKEAYDMFDFHQVKAVLAEMMEKID